MPPRKLAFDTPFTAHSQKLHHDTTDPFDAVREFEHAGGTHRMVHLTVLEERGLCEPETLPVSIRVLLESVPPVDGESITAEDVENVASWARDVPDVELPFTPSRVLLQDLAGVPAVVDLAALRSAAQRNGADPTIVAYVRMHATEKHDKDVDEARDRERLRSV